MANDYGYYVAKAAEVFIAKFGAPANCERLAAWARHHRDDSTVQGVIVAEDGEIMANTWRSGDRVGATYVDSAGTQRWSLGMGNEVGLALGAIARRSGKRVTHVKRSDVCFGSYELISARARAYADDAAKARRADATAFAKNGAIVGAIQEYLYEFDPGAHIDTDEIIRHVRSYPEFRKIKEAVIRRILRDGVRRKIWRVYGLEPEYELAPDVRARWRY